MLKWTSKGSLNARDRVNHSLPSISWHELEAAGERDVNLVNKVLDKSTPGHGLEQANLQSFARPFSNSFVSDASSGAMRNLPLASAPSSPLSNAKDFFRYQSISLPASPERGSNPSAILDEKKRKRGVFKKLKKLFRKPKSKDLKNTPQASPTLKTKRPNAVIGRTMSSIDGTNVAAPKTRLVRLIESKKAQRKSKRSLLDKTYVDESESYSSDDNRIPNHSALSDAKHFDIFASPCPSLNSLVAQLSLDAPEYEDVASAFFVGAKPHSNPHNSNSFSTDKKFMAVDPTTPAMNHVTEKGGATANVTGFPRNDQPTSMQEGKKKHVSASDSLSTSFVNESDERSWIMSDKFSDKTEMNERITPVFKRNPLDKGLGAKSLDGESDFSDQRPGLELHESDSGSSLHKFAKILEVIKQSGSFEKVKVMPTSPDKIIQIKSQLTPVSTTNSNSTDTVQMASSLDQWSWQEERPLGQDNSSDDQNESDQKETYSPLQPPYTRNNNNGHHTYHHDMVTTPYMMDSTVREASFISYGDAGTEPSRVSSLAKSFQDNEKMASVRRPPHPAYARVDQLQDTGLVSVRDTVKRISYTGRENLGVTQNENSHFIQATPGGKDQREHGQEDVEENKNTPTLVLSDDAKVTLKTPKVVRFLLQDDSIVATEIPVERYDVDSADDNESCSVSDVAEYDTGPSFNSSNQFSEEIPSDSNITFTSDTNAFCSDVSDTLSGASYPKELPSENSGKYEPSLGSVVQLVCDSFITSLPDKDAERQSTWNTDTQKGSTKTIGDIPEVRICESRSPLTCRPLEPKADITLQSIDGFSAHLKGDEMESSEVSKISEHADAGRCASFEDCLIPEQSNAEKIAFKDNRAINTKAAISPPLEDVATTFSKTKLPGESVSKSPSEYEECITDVRPPNLMLIHDFSPVEPNVTSPVEISCSLESAHLAVTQHDTSPLEKQPGECNALEVESVVSKAMDKINTEILVPCQDTEIPQSAVSPLAGRDRKTCIELTEESDGTVDDMPNFDARVNKNEWTTKKKRVSFQLESLSPDWSSQSDDIAIMEMTLQQDDKSADEALVSMGDEITTDVSVTGSSLKTNEVQDLDFTVPNTSNSVDDVSWWGNEINEDIEFFHDRMLQKDQNDVKEQCHVDLVSNRVQQRQPNSGTPSNDSLLQYETTENSHNVDSSSDQEKFLTLSKFLSTESAFLKATSQNQEITISPVRLVDDISVVSSEDDGVLKFEQSATQGLPERHELLPIQELGGEHEQDANDDLYPLCRDSFSREEVTSEEKKNTESEINTLTYNVSVLKDDVDKQRAWWDGPSPVKSTGSSIMHLDLEGDASSSLSDCISQSNSLLDVDSDRTSPTHGGRFNQKGSNLAFDFSPFGSKVIEQLSGPNSIRYESPFSNVNEEKQTTMESKLKPQRNPSITSSQSDDQHGSSFGSSQTDGKQVSPVSCSHAVNKRRRSILARNKAALKVKKVKLKPESRISEKPLEPQLQNAADQKMAHTRLEEAGEVLDLSPLDYTHRVKFKNASNESGLQERKTGSGVGGAGKKSSHLKKGAGINRVKVVSNLTSPPKMTNYESLQQDVDQGSQGISVDSIYCPSLSDQYTGKWGENGSGDSEFSASSASFKTESLNQMDSIMAADTLMADTVLREYLRQRLQKKRKSIEVNSNLLDSPGTISLVSTSIPREFTSSPNDTDQVWEQSQEQVWENRHYLNKNDLTASLRPQKMRTFAQAVGERFEEAQFEKRRNDKSELSEPKLPAISSTQTFLQETRKPPLKNTDTDPYTEPENRKSSTTDKTASKKSAPNTGSSHVQDVNQENKNGHTAGTFPAEAMTNAGSRDELEDAARSSPADNYETQHCGSYRRLDQPPTNSSNSQYSSARNSQLPFAMSSAPRSPGRVQQGRSNPPQVPSETDQVLRKSKSKLEHQPGEWLFIATFFVFQLLMHWLYAA